MNSKLILFTLLATLSTVIFAGCTSAESKAQEEVYLGNGSSKNEEVIISNADLQKNEPQQQTAQNAANLANRMLGDGSEIQTMIDGYGNKTESRYFKHPRLRLVVLRTAANGQKEVAVYGNTSETKFLNDWGDKALTASADEIASAAQLTATRTESPDYNYLKKRRNDASAPLRPLPSSEFQVPSSPAAQQPDVPAQPSTEEKPGNIESPQEEDDL